MACALTQDITLGCRDSVGGIKTIYVTELANKNAITSASGIITAFTLTTGKQFWQYDIEKEVGSVTENIQTSVENGTVFYEQDVTFTLNKVQASLQQEIKLLAQNRVMVIALDRNGKYWLLGENNGCDLQPSTAATGKAMGDFNGYTLNLKGKETAPANEVTSSLIATLIAPA
jgi:hypothetical protein